MCDGHDIGISIDSGGIDRRRPAAGGADRSPRAFIYDNYPGGIGFSRRCIEMHDELLRARARLIAECECENGCPGCVGPIGNTGPLAKVAALRILRSAARARHVDGTGRRTDELEDQRPRRSRRLELARRSHPRIVGCRRDPDGCRSPQPSPCASRRPMPTSASRSAARGATSARARCFVVERRWARRRCTAASWCAGRAARAGGRRGAAARRRRAGARRRSSSSISRRPV